MSDILKVREFLIEKEPNCSKLFENLDKCLQSIMSDDHQLTVGRVTYAQSLQAFKFVSELDASGQHPASYSNSQKRGLGQSIRLVMYHKGSVIAELEAFIYVKRAVIKDLLTAFLNAINGPNIISALVLVRPVLEHVSALNSVFQEIGPLLDGKNLSLNDKYEKLSQLEEVIATGGKGTRIDWESYFKKSLRSGKKKSYKPVEGAIDHTASNLMQNIDLMDKSVKGCRKAYEFASEFAHPNGGPNLIYYKSSYSEELKDGIQLNHITRYSNFPEQGMEVMQPRLIEICEILVESLGMYEDQLRKLERKKMLVSKWVSQLTKGSASNHPDAINSKEPCPCFSGKIFGKCCGKAASR